VALGHALVLLIDAGVFEEPSSAIQALETGVVTK
jgi:hypothetical protein